MAAVACAALQRCCTVCLVQGFTLTAVRDRLSLLQAQAPVWPKAAWPSAHRPSRSALGNDTHWSSDSGLSELTALISVHPQKSQASLMLELDKTVAW